LAKFRSNIEILASVIDSFCFDDLKYLFYLKRLMDFENLTIDENFELIGGLR
jgi:hypothetical protein